MRFKLGILFTIFAIFFALAEFSSLSYAQIYRDIQPSTPEGRDCAAHCTVRRDNCRSECITEDCRINCESNYHICYTDCGGTVIVR